MFPSDTATLMWKHTTDLEPQELASLGFRIVAGWVMLFRPNMLENEYSALGDVARSVRYSVLQCF